MMNLPVGSCRVRRPSLPTHTKAQEAHPGRHSSASLAGGGRSRDATKGASCYY